MGFYTEQENNMFHEIEENPIILDFLGCKYLGEIHLILKIKFGLPNYYGENWNALWDCLDGLFNGRGEYQVNIFGFYALPDALREECVKMLEVFDDVHNETPNITFALIS